MYFNEYCNNLFLLRLKHLDIPVYLKRLSSLFTLISTVYCINVTFARNRKSLYLCSASERCRG